MATVTDWTRYPNFSRLEFACKHTGQCEMDSEFMDVLQVVRTRYARPMRISSGYRHPTHPIEAAKGGLSRGEHTMGRCCDVAVEGDSAVTLLRIALESGIVRVGVQQKGGGRFLHLGLGGPGLASPWIWSY